MKNMYYILDEFGNPVEESDIIKWGEWFSKNNHRRTIRKTRIGDDAILVSTVFLGINHNFIMEGEPLIFETMVFCKNELNPMHNYQLRYSNSVSAVSGHKKIVDTIKASISN